MTLIRKDAGGCALLAAAVALLYRKVLALWWMYDDAYHLHTVITHDAGRFFTDPAVWRAMPNRLFTPILQASYDGELALFGMEPRRFYAVHLLEMVLAAIAVYAALRLWTSWLPALAGAMVFIAGAPMASVATQLMVMHYLEAIILGAVAVIAYVIAVRRGRPPLAILSAVFYFAAMLAKEIAAPLLLFLLVLPEVDVRRRARYAAPHAIALAAYTAWRWLMLGELFGGYGWAVTGKDVLPLLASIPSKLWLAMRGPHVWTGLCLLLAILAILVWRIRGRAFLLIALALFLAVAPIVPVAKEMQPRFAVMAWLVLSCAVAIAVPKGKAGAAALGVVVLLTLVVNRQAWADEMRRARRMSDEGRFFFYDIPPGAVLREPAIPPAALGEIRWLKEDYARRPAGATWFYDDYFRCAHDLGAAPVWSYEPAARGLVRQTADQARQRCASIREAPLSAEVSVRGDTIFWKLGPYDEGGQYRFLFADGLQAFDVPRQDGFRMRGVDALAFRVGYRSPAGWMTYSPEMSVDFRRQTGASWHR